MKILKSLGMVVLAFYAITTSTVYAEETKQEAPKPQVLFKNVNVFDGKSDMLRKGMNVLVEGNLIKTVSKGAKANYPKATVIDGGGRTLMPGLIDNHVHFSLTGATPSIIENDMTREDIAYNAVPTAEMY